MARLLEYQTAGGSSVVVQVDDLAGGVVPVASPGEIAARARQTFEETMGVIQPTADAFADRVHQLRQVPDEARLEFEIGLDFEAGAFVAKIGGDASFKVALVWRRGV